MNRSSSAPPSPAKRPQRSLLARLKYPLLAALCSVGLLYALDPAAFGKEPSPTPREAPAAQETPRTQKGPAAKPPSPPKQGTAKRGAPQRASAPQAAVGLGVGVGAPLDFEQDVTFADAIKVARKMEPAEGVESDEHGWLRGDGAILVWAGPGIDTAGTYKLQYDGKADVSVDLAQAQLSKPVYDAATDTSTQEVKLASGQDTLKLSFANTTAGVRNVKFMRPLYPGAAKAHEPDELWYRPMKELHRRFEWLRVMDFTATNGQNVVSWCDRTLPGRFSQQNPVEGTWWQGRGAAWEYAVHLANEAQKDLWISVPLLADDEYVRNLARLLRYGSDGKAPYTSKQKNPVWAPLDPRLKLYVEYSNEIWNFGFPQWTQLLEHTKAEVERGKTNLNFDGSTSDGDWNTRHWARRLVEVSTIFREVFGDDAMMTRVRPVFSTQLGWADNYLWQGLWFMDAWYNNGDGKQHVKTPHPVSYYVWGAGGSTYPVGFPEELEKSKELTVAKIFQGYRNMVKSWSENQRRDVDYARAFGLKRISYEGGPGLDNIGGDEFKKANAAKFAAQKDPRIKQVYLDMLKRYAELGGDGFTNFLTTNPSHGVLSNYESKSVDSPKTKALDQVLSSKRPAPTWGVPLPATVWAGRYRVASHQSTGEKDEAMAFDAATWLSYTVRNEAQARYSLKVIAGSEDEKARLHVWVDGELAGTLSIPKTGDTNSYAESAPLTIELAAGQHGIRLDGATGTFSVKQLKIEPAAAQASKE